MNTNKPVLLYWPIFETVIIAAGERGAVRIKNARRLKAWLNAPPANDNTDQLLNPDGTVKAH